MNLPETIQEILPLSAVQAGMLVHSVGAASDTGAYVGVVSAVIEGQLEAERLKRAFQSALQDHDILRASFVFKGTKQPVQVIHRTLNVPWQMDDWTDAPQQEIAQRKRALVETERRSGFDLSDPPLMRLHLIRLGDDRHLFVWCLHHILSDGWSTTTFLSDVLRLYDLGDTARDQAGERRTTFKDYLVWAKRRKTDEARAYWSRHMAGFQGPTTIPAVTPDRADGSLHRISTRQMTVEQTARLDQTARRLRVTQSSFLAAIWALTLRRYSGSDDITFGVTTAGRPVELPGVARTVGPFLNTLPLRMSARGDTTFASFATQVEAEMRARAAHEFVALKDVRDWSGATRDMQLFDALFAHESIPGLDATEGPLRLTDLEILGPSNYPLAMIATPVDGCRLELYHDPAAYPRDIIDHILADYLAMIERAVEAPDDPVSRLLWPGADEISEPRPEDDGLPSVVSAFWDAAKTYADAPAVSDANETLSYSALQERIKSAAAVLQSAGIGPGDVVPVAVDRSVQAIVAYFAVMATGAAYVPLDLEYPPDRIRSVLVTLPARQVLSTTGACDRVPDGPWSTICIDARPASGQAFSPSDLPPDSLAYVLFTSGSQGVPKGVAISHGALAHSTSVRTETYGGDPRCFLLLSSLAFDSSVAGLFWTLCAGGHLVLAPRRLENDPRGLAEVLSGHQVTHTLCLPRLYHELLGAVPSAQLRSLTTVIVAGEAVQPDLVQRHRQTLPDCRLFNEYGPTEATVWATVYDTAEYLADGPVPIGRAIPGVDVGVRDQDGLLLPMGVQGQISISGPTLARGYLGAAEETERKFPHLPGKGSLARTYLTGDLGTQTPRGLLFAGRADQQIKLRGHRIETGEIDAVIRDTLGPVACCALVIPAGAGEMLVACIESDPGTGSDRALLQAFDRRLPDFARPRRVLWFEHLDRLPNGKLDLHKISDRAGASGAAAAEVSDPATLTEAKLARIWAEVLNVEAISRESNFFDLGGDSLTTIALFALCERQGLSLSPNDIFEHPTLAGLAEHLTTTARSELPHDNGQMVRKVHGTGTRPPVIFVHGNMHVFYQLARTLGKDRPIGLKFSHLFEGMTLPLGTTIGDLAKETLNDFSDFLQNDRCILVGYSAGCAIAQDMAQRISKAGGSVDLLCLIDPPLELSRPHDDYVLPRRQLGRSLNAGSVLARYATLNAVHSLAGSENRRRRLKVNTATAVALSRFSPEPFDGRVLCFTSAQLAGSSALFSKAEVEHISGSHMDLLQDPDASHAVVSRLAAEIRKLED